MSDPQQPIYCLASSNGNDHTLKPLLCGQATIAELGLEIIPQWSFGKVILTVRSFDAQADNTTPTTTIKIVFFILFSFLPPSCHK